MAQQEREPGTQAPARADDPRERILAAASAIFLDQGFELATVREITRAPM